ncbi:hypothetical protein FA10DRAFT_182811 [Acaromyces ingoldii]|uniref:Xylanolytic transcriptional activator regulatory domain-containing protein n=1 Tax=Acaromyces ingoldii TaxID=215250 RepID=A0A316YGS1_9BASI|nr:hypothetical protein FA10DRAFT_182811 [Acaromyces ingoldii]PWN87303.1 hypothetical protein FA10DRAFT_182811 [Acaromyces ingoldii]
MDAAADDGTFDWLFSSSLFPSAWPLEEEAVVEKQLPIAYERTTPTELPNTSVVGPDEGRVRFHMLGSPHPATLLAENTCQVAPLLQVAKDRLLLLPTLAQQIPDEEKQGTQKMLAAVSPETLNVFVQLFFQHFDRLCSVVHRPTFDPNYCEVFLLGAICALGSMYSAIENASRFGHSLMSLVNRAIFGVWPRTREYGRSLPFIQALLLNFNFFRSSGTREMLELAESLRSPLTTMIRKCRLLEPGEGRHPEDWKAWVDCETKKRTAWAYFTADMELSMVWSLAPSFAFDELNAELPGDEARWRAASAATWRSIGDNSPRILLNQLHTDPHALYLCGSGAQKVVFSSSLCSLGTSLHSMRSSCLDAVIDMATSQLVQACQALRFSGTSTALPELLLRFMMLISTIDTYDLQALVRATDTDAAFERVERRLARANALEHVLVQAGRIVGLCRTQASESLYEGCFFFYAASALYGCSRILLGRALPVDCTSQRIDGLAALSPATGEPFRPLLEGIGDITALDAPWRILNHYSSYLLNRPLRTSWPITGLLGRFLADMASAVVASSGQPASTPGRIVSRV